MLNTFDIYLMNIEHRLEAKGLTSRPKWELLKKIAKHSENWQCFKSITDFFTATDDEDDEMDFPFQFQQYPAEAVAEVYYPSPEEIDKRINAKQRELGITPKKSKPKQNRLEFGRTPLHQAVFINDVGAVRNALSKGINPKTRDNNGDTAYSVAALYENNDMMRILEGLNANVI